MNRALPSRLASAIASICFPDIRIADIRIADIRIADIRIADIRIADIRIADIRIAGFCIAGFCIAGICILSTSLASATIYSVHPDGSGDFPTIQAAVDAVLDDDVIELTDGMFTGDGNLDVDYLGKAITIRSQSGNPELCVIECDGSPTNPHRGFLFRRAETPASILEGVTVRNGYAPPAGGAIFLKGASAPTIRACIFSGNSDGAIYCINDAAPTFTNCLFELNTGFWGGAISCEWSTLTLTNCSFIENDARFFGGAIHCYDSEAVITGVRFLRNTAETTAAADFQDGSTATIVDCLFDGNVASSSGGAVRIFCGCVASIEGCTFINNQGAGGAGALFSEKISTTHVRNCTFWGNTSAEGVIVAGHQEFILENSIVAFNQPGPALVSYYDYAELSCCDLFGNAGGDWVGSIADQLGVDGNICEEPLLCAPMQDNFELRETSPCAPPQSGACGLIGAWPVGCGPSSVEAATWGSIKASFR